MRGILGVSEAFLGVFKKTKEKKDRVVSGRRGLEGIRPGGVGAAGIALLLLGES